MDWERISKRLATTAHTSDTTKPMDTMSGYKSTKELMDIYNGINKIVHDPMTLHQGTSNEGKDIFSGLTGYMPYVDDRDDDMRMKKKAVFDDNYYLKERCARLQREIDDLNSQLVKQTRAKHEGFSSDVFTNRQELDKIQKEKAGLNRILRETLAERENMSAKMQELQIENKLLRNELNTEKHRIQDDDDDTRIQIIKLKDEIAKKETEIEDAKIEKRKYIDLYDELKKQSGKEREAIMDRAERQKAEVERGLRDIIEKKDTIERDIQLRKDISIETDITRLKTRNIGLKSANEELALELNNLKSDMETKLKRISELEHLLIVSENKRSSLESEIEALAHKIKLSDQSRNNLAKQKEMDDNSRLEITEEITKAKNDASNLKAALDRQSREVSSLRDKYSNLEVEHVSKVQENNRLEKKM